MTLDDDMPPLGKLNFAGQIVGHGTPCRWHEIKSWTALKTKMARNGKGAFLCPTCDVADPCSCENCTAERAVA